MGRGEMGRRGPRGKSPEVESAQGFPGRRKSETKRAITAAKAPKTTDHDSPNVPHQKTPAPKWLKSKRALAIWDEIMADPGRQLWFKPSDHPLIARHCAKRARLETLMRRPPLPTYETTTGAGGRRICANPAYTEMMALDREVRAEEQLLAGNPVARLDMQRRTTAVNDKPPPLRPGDSTPPESPPLRSGPLGALKSAARPARPN